MAKEEEEGKNVNTAKQLYDAFKSRDISTLLDIFTDDALSMDQHEPGPPVGRCSLRTQGSFL